MFGNRLGWGISGALAALVLFVVYQLAKLNAISPPSTGVVAATGRVALNLRTNGQIMDVIQLPFDVKAVMPAMTEPNDAGPAYREAVSMYLENPSLYDNVIDEKTKAPKSDKLADFPAIRQLIDVRNHASMDLYKGKLEEAINVNSRVPGVIAGLYKVGKGAGKLGMHVKEGRPGDARLLGEAIFSLGVKMCQERLRWFEFEHGADLLREGAYLIKAADPARAEAAGAVDEAMRKLLKERCIPLWTVIGSLDQNVIGRSAGDVFHVAQYAPERMWRIEAMLKLGRYKYNAGEGGKGADQRWARIMLKRWANDASLDPAVRVAAQTGHAMTEEDFNRFGS
jgi:hypothetical protein